MKKEGLLKIFIAPFWAVVRIFEYITEDWFFNSFNPMVIAIALWLLITSVLGTVSGNYVAMLESLTVTKKWIALVICYFLTCFSFAQVTNVPVNHPFGLDEGNWCYRVPIIFFIITHFGSAAVLSFLVSFFFL